MEKHTDYTLVFYSLLTPLVFYHSTVINIRSWDLSPIFPKMAQNATCDRETLYNLGNVSQSLSMFAVIYAAVAYTTFVVGYSVWYRYRKVPYLNSRDVPLLFISTCAVALATFSGLTSRHLGDVVPCELFVICYLYAFPGAGKAYLPLRPISQKIYLGFIQLSNVESLYVVAMRIIPCSA